MHHAEILRAPIAAARPLRHKRHLMTDETTPSARWTQRKYSAVLFMLSNALWLSCLVVPPCALSVLLTLNKTRFPSLFPSEPVTYSAPSSSFHVPIHYDLNNLVLQVSFAPKSLTATLWVPPTSNGASIGQILS